MGSNSGKGQMPLQTGPERRVKLSTLVNVLLGMAVALMAVFGYFYLKQQAPKPIKALVDIGVELANVPPRWRANIVPPPSSSLNRPLMVAVDEKRGEVYVADTSNNRIQVFSRDGKWLRRFGRFGRGPGEFDFPYTIAIRNGYLYVADRDNKRIQILQPDGKFVAQIPDPKKHKNLEFVPLGLFAGGDGNLYVTSKDNRVLVFDKDDKLIREFGKGGYLPGQLSYPNGVVVDKAGQIWVTDSNNARIQVFSPDGSRVIRVIEGFTVPQGISIDEKGRIWVADPIQHKVYAYDSNGTLIWTIGERGMDEGQFNFPSGVFAAGKDIYVVDRENARIVVFGF